MNLCWLTDIHLNFLSEKERFVFYEQINKKDCAGILIAGDIADAPSLNLILKEMVQALQKPIYFVLGNHDYYHSEINEVKTEIETLCSNNSMLHWLPKEKFVLLNKDTILLGQDGWADGRYGDYQNSSIVLNDSRLIYDLFSQSILGKNKLLDKMQELADIDAQALQDDLSNSITEETKKIILLTHVSPFEGSCWHEGEISAPDWMPFFTSKAIGDVISQAAQDHPTIDFLVLCGHTHSSGIYKPLPNLLVKSGKAEYYKPEIQGIIEI